MRFFSFQRISNLPSKIKVSIRDHAFHDPVEKLYYSCGYVWACLILWGVSGWFRQKGYTVPTVWKLWWAQDLSMREEMKTKCLFFPIKCLYYYSHYIVCWFWSLIKTLYVITMHLISWKYQYVGLRQPEPHFLYTNVYIKKIMNNE